MKVLNLKAHDASGKEMVYVDIRAKQKADRSPELLQSCCQQTADLMASHGYPSKVRLEIYIPELQFSAESE